MRAPLASGIHRYFLLAAIACSTAAMAGEVATPNSTAHSPSCAAAADDAHAKGWDTPVLYGRWTATFPLHPNLPHTVLQLGPHAQWQGTAQGTATAQGATAWVVGDVNEGDMTLEESADGTRIRATWLGTVQPDSCGLRIEGALLADEDDTGTPFILHKSCSPTRTDTRSGEVRC